MFDPSGGDGKAPMSPILDLVTKVTQNIKSILNTEPGDRPMRNIGLPLRWLLYEPADELTALVTQGAIKQQLMKYEPRAKFPSIKVTISQTAESVILSVLIKAILKDTNQSVDIAENIVLAR